MRLFALLIAYSAAALIPHESRAVDYHHIPIPEARDHVFIGHDRLLLTAESGLYHYDLDTCTTYESTPFTASSDLYGIDMSMDGRFVAVADRTIVDDMARLFLYDRKGLRTPRTIRYPAGFMESGSYMVAWGADGRLLISGSFAGSGWVDLRQYDPLTDQTTIVDSVRQNSMLSRSHDGTVIGLAESNISSGPVHIWDVKGEGITTSFDTGWFMFEIAVSPKGRRMIAPSYSGAFVLENGENGLEHIGTIGEYADWGPISAVYTPNGMFLITANWAWSSANHTPGIHVYDAKSLEWIAMLDGYDFQWAGNNALNEGRLTISDSGRWLAVNVEDGVRVYDLQLLLGGVEQPFTERRNCSTRQ